MAASLVARVGAKPPSSPWPIEWPSSCRSVRSAQNTSEPARTASANATPTGATMNSWKSVRSTACLPPLRMLKNGTGRLGARPAPR